MLTFKKLKHRLRLKTWGKNHSKNDITQILLARPERFFKGAFDTELEWEVIRCGADFFGLPASHRLCLMNNIVCKADDITIGWVEGISMHSGGTVRIQHFAISTDLTRNNQLQVGLKFLAGLLRFFKSKNATAIEFHETHTRKINHYRHFFEKNNIKEIDIGIWKIDLYKGLMPPLNVIEFQSSLKVAMYR
ncbi:hypothetical protein [Aeromonas veronii]|uniref:hypothetical protein n=1 Tax=Aeromonas veronii TaxID=654 RepID=UPI0013022FEA|nr:hypothetical protein [Aeromonas veronii]KAE9635984.1 hypothetical protein GO977_08895 [Aeromonas veronii]